MRRGIKEEPLPAISHVNWVGGAVAQLATPTFMKRGKGGGVKNGSKDMEQK